MGGSPDQSEGSWRPASEAGRSGGGHRPPRGCTGRAEGAGASPAWGRVILSAQLPPFLQRQIALYFFTLWSAESQSFPCPGSVHFLEALFEVCRPWRNSTVALIRGKQQTTSLRQKHRRHHAFAPRGAIRLGHGHGKREVVAVCQGLQDRDGENAGSHEYDARVSDHDGFYIQKIFKL